MGERLMPSVIGYPEQKPYIVDGSLALDVRSSYYPLPGQESNVIFLERRQKSPLQEQIDHFNKNYISEDLPRDWWRINDVGFSMKRQMDLLQRPDPMSVSVWAEQTERDFLGFALEYLVKRKVFPFEYRIEGERFIDEKYGNREMLEMIDPREREGSVLETARRARGELLKGKDVAIVSPKGKAGITMDDGREIDYPDTMVFYMQRNGDKIIGTGFSLGFNLEEARQLVEKLTGKAVPKTASAIDCVKELVTFGEDSEVKNPYDLIKVIKTVKNEPRLSDMVTDLGRRDTLYNFDIETKKIIQEFKDYVVSQELSELEIQKALAATFLRLSKYMLDNQREESRTTIEARSGEIRLLPTTYGQIMNEVRKIPGCAGGGSGISSISSIINRTTFTGENAKNDPNLCRCGGQEPHFHCPGKNGGCGHAIIVGEGTSACPKCGAGQVCE